MGCRSGLQMTAYHSGQSLTPGALICSVPVVAGSTPSLWHQTSRPAVTQQSLLAALT